MCSNLFVFCLFAFLFYEQREQRSSLLRQKQKDTLRGECWGIPAGFFILSFFLFLSLNGWGIFD